MPTVQWSVVLATIAAILVGVAGLSIFAGTPWPDFLVALATFINAVALLLVALGVITLARLLKVELP